MMDKRGNEGIPCGLCGEPAEHGTNPPRCRRHRETAQRKEAGEAPAPRRLKRLEEAPDGLGRL